MPPDASQPGAAAAAPGADASTAAPAAADAAALAPAAPAEAAPAAAPALPGVEPGKSEADAAKSAAAAPASEFKPSLLDAAAAVKPADNKAAETKAADVKPMADAKPGETAKPEPGKDGAAAESPAPIAYAFSYPEGVSADSVNAETMGKFTGLLNEGRTSPEVAQKLLDLHLSEMGEIASKLAQRQWDAFNTQQNRWREEVMADPVLGGARHQTAIREVMAVVDHYAGEQGERQALLDAFRTTGIANNPAFLRFLHRASLDLVREAAPHPAPPPRSSAPTGRDRGLNRYRNTTPANAR